MKDTAYYVVETLKVKEEYFKKMIEHEREMIEVHREYLLPLDQEKGEKEIFRCECRIEAFKDALEAIEKSEKIWEE